ncbi:MAG: hypothetical protein AB1486_28870 [Planctomycetota bacterium]
MLHPRAATFFLFAAMLLPTACAATKPPSETPHHKDEGALFQVVFGASRLDDEASSTSSGTATADISTVPVVGFWGQQALAGESVNLGVEGGIQIGLWQGDTDLVSFSPERIVFEIDSWLFLTDLAAGAFVGTWLGDSVRLYAGAGPFLAFGIYEADDDDVEESGAEIDTNEAALTLGTYARAGVDLRITRESSVGLGVRAIRADLDFDPVEIELDGFQYFLVLSHVF